MKTTKISSIYLALFMLILSSCEKQEQPIEKEHIPGDQTTSSVSINPDYKYQVFFDLETNTEVSQNLTTAWDLSFDCRDEGYQIKLNFSKAMQVWNTEQTNFSNVTSASNGQWKWDNPNGSLDSTAISEWGVKNGNNFDSKNEIYVLDLGFDSQGNQKGYKKMQILGLEGNEYSVKIADLSGDNEFVFFIKKDTDYNFVFLSISERKLVTIEPPKDDWDLVFTKYTHTFFMPDPLIYGVTGVLITSNSTTVHEDTIYGFENIDYQIAQELNYSTDINVIGYDWKYYSHNSGGYTILDNSYVIKNRAGNYYKFQVTDFFNESGQKGNIKFDFQRL
jgi:hypothetical protein